MAGTLTDEEAQQVQAELKTNDELADLYLSYVNLDVGLESAAAAADMEIELPRVVSTPSNPWSAWFQWRPLAAAAVLVLGFGLALWLPRKGGELSTRTDAEPAAAGFAVITAQVDTRWGGGRSLATGGLLSRGVTRLEAGMAQIELFSGVSIVVEGEAEFEIVSPMEMAVTRGKVRVRVPEPAKGFRIRTAEGDVVDLGTEFALNVTPTKSEMHVIDGEVEWHPRAEPMRRMVGGEALQWSASGKGTPMTANASDLTSASDLSAKLSAVRTARRDNWTGFSEKLQRDPNLVAYFQMGRPNDENRGLTNTAVAGATIVQEGAIVAAARVTDRWGTPGGALDFSPTGSRVRVNVPGEYRSITLLTWVKINSLDRWYNSLFLTDGAQVNEPHWQIRDDGRLYFSVKKNATWDPKKGEKDKHAFPFTAVLERLAQWSVVDDRHRL